MSIAGSGRLEFTALPAATSGAQTTIGGFKSMTGIDVEFEVAEYGVPGRRCTLRGRVISVVAVPGSPLPNEPRPESVTFAYQRIIWT